MSCPSSTSFVEKFKDFAKDEQTAMEVEIKKVGGELVALQEKLAASLENAKKSLGNGLAVGALGAVFLGLLFPPAWPAILVSLTALNVFYLETTITRLCTSNFLGLREH